MKPASSKNGAFKRVSSVDASAAEAIFNAAILLLEPEEKTQRKVFGTLMPYLFVLRNKGCSWPQLTKLVNDAGLHLQPSTVRTYYSEMLADRQDICQERMNEQLMVLAEIREKTSGEGMSAIAEKVSTSLKARKASEAAAVASVFKLNGSGVQPKLELEPPAAALNAKNENTGRSPDLEANNSLPQIEAADGGFGLLNLTSPSEKTASSTGFFGLDEDPAVPVLRTPAIEETFLPSVSDNFSSGENVQKNSKTGLRPVPAEKNKAVYISESATPKFVCQPLQPGVAPLKKRDNLPAEVYLPGEMPHPLIPDLMLSMEERLYGATLEYLDRESGEIKMENDAEKRFRLAWRKPIPMAKSKTAGDFMVLKPEAFEKAPQFRTTSH